MSAPEPAGGDDRILPVTRWVAVLIVPFLLVAAVVLFAFPHRTGELFAWQITPPLSAALLASAYLGGIWFFLRTALARRWHHVAHGFPAVVVFAAALLVATLLHLDRFSRNLPFVVWIMLYATTPFLILALALVQARRFSRTPDDRDTAVPFAPRIALALIGAVALAFGVTVFVAPEWAASFWAWELTPLTAQVTGAVLSLTGVVNAPLLWDERWSAFRVLFQAQLLSLAAIAVSLVTWRDDLRWERPMTTGFVVLVGGAILSYAVFAVWCELRVRGALRAG